MRGLMTNYLKLTMNVFTKYSLLQIVKLYFITIFNDIDQQIFPARAPSSEVKISEMRDNYGISPGLNRTAHQQAVYQLLSLAVTLGISIISGLITGTSNHFYIICCDK